MSTNLDGLRERIATELEALASSVRDWFTYAQQEADKVSESEGTTEPVEPAGDGEPATGAGTEEPTDTAGDASADTEDENAAGDASGGAEEPTDPEHGKPNPDAQGFPGETAAAEEASAIADGQTPGESSANPSQHG